MKLNIFNIWEDEGWIEPKIEEKFDPDRTVLTLGFKKDRKLIHDTQEYMSFLRISISGRIKTSVEEVFYYAPIPLLIEAALIKVLCYFTFKGRKHVTEKFQKTAQ